MPNPPRRLPPRPVAAKPLQSSAKPLPRPAPKLPSRGAPVRPTPKAPNRLSNTVEDGFDRARMEREKQQAEAERRKNMAFPFRMKVGEKTKNPKTGKEEAGVEIMILDTCKLPAMPYFHYYHRWGFKMGVKGSGKEDVCLKETADGCPLCEELGREGNWEMNLTVIDKRPYTPQSGPNAGKPRAMSRLLLTAKSKMIPHFEDLYKDHGKFRGMVVRMYRDNDKDEAIGSRAKFVRFVSEADIRKLPKELTEIVDYKAAWPLCSREELARRNRLGHGGGSGGSGVGSADFDNGDTGDDSIPF